MMLPHLRVFSSGGLKVSHHTRSYWGVRAAVTKPIKALPLVLVMRTAPTGETTIQWVGDENFLGVAHAWLIAFPALPW